LAAAVLRSCVASEVVSTVFSRPKRSGKREKKSQKTSFLEMLKFLTRSIFHKLLFCFHSFFFCSQIFFVHRFSFTSLFSPSNCCGTKNKPKNFFRDVKFLTRLFFTDFFRSQIFYFFHFFFFLHKFSLFHFIFSVKLQCD
jgi:hypothetical protein